MVHPRLTPEGIACVKRFGGDVEKYEKAQQTTGDVFNIKGENIQVATGNKSKQTMKIGADAGEILKKVEGLMDIVRGLGYEDPALDDLYKEAQQDLTSGKPTGKPAQGLLAHIKSVAANVGNAALDMVVNTVGPELLDMLSHLA